MYWSSQGDPSAPQSAWVSTVQQSSGLEPVPCCMSPVAAGQTQADCCTGGAWRQLPFSATSLYTTFPALPHNSASENILNDESHCLARQIELEWRHLVSDLPVLISTQSFYFSHRIFSHFEEKWWRSAELPTGVKPPQISVEPELFLKKSLSKCWTLYERRTIKEHLFSFLIFYRLQRHVKKYALVLLVKEVSLLWVSVVKPVVKGDI